jgi:hypothetical protein
MKEKQSNIPQSVLTEAKNLIDFYGDTLEYIGEYEGYGVYQFVFPENKETGFPFIYIYDPEDESVLEVTGFRALDIIKELYKNINKK